MTEANDILQEQGSDGSDASEVTNGLELTSATSGRDPCVRRLVRSSARGSPSGLHRMKQKVSNHFEF